VSGQTPAQEVEVEVEVDQKNKDICAAEQREHFEGLWKSYPRKLGKKAAWNHYKASVKTPEAQTAIVVALARFKKRLAEEGTATKYIPHGSKWFNNWQDWVGFEEPTVGGKTAPDPPYFFKERFDGGRTMYVLVKKDGTRKLGDPFEQERWFKAGVPHAKELDKV